MNAQMINANNYELAIRQRDDALAEVERLRAALAAAPAQQQASTVPAGWKLVPIKATVAMENAYFKVIDKNMQRVQTDCTFGRYSNFQSAYPELLAAAPQPPASPAHALTDAASEVTPIFLLNVALCIEDHDLVVTSTKREILAKLHRIADAMQTERMTHLARKG